MFSPLLPNWPYNNRDLRGANLAEAFKRASDPDLLAQLNECERNINSLLAQDGSAQEGAEPKLAFYRQRQAQVHHVLIEKFTGMLCARKLAASGFVEPIGPTSKRIPIEQDLWEFLAPDLRSSSASGERVRFARVEVFSGLPPVETTTEDANEPPRRTEAVGWQRREQDPEFVHSPDYTLVTVRGHRFELGAAAAAIVRKLHEAHLSGTPMVSERDLLDGTAQSRIDTLFARKKAPSWKELIRKAARGHYELNLTVPAKREPPSVNRQAWRKGSRRHFVNASRASRRQPSAHPR